ncbi:MAG TPA: FtsX-like permease family protein [Alphaproteobacteria bacterium]|nr:FtsX-like permease family protein [Alphaproteobacteria bacterium]
MSGGLRLSLALGLRDLRGGARRLRIFVACLTLGVAAIAGVGSLGQAVRAGIAADARMLLGGDLELRLVHREISPEQRSFLADRARLSEAAQLRAMARRLDNAARRLVELKAVDGAYPLVGAATIAPALDLGKALGRSEDGRWGAVAERALFDRLGLEIGAEIALGEARYVLRAVLEREPDRGVQAFFGPRLLIALESLPETGLLQPGSLVYRHYRLAMPEPEAALRLAEELRARYPDAPWRLRGLTEAAPGLQRFVQRTELYLILVALSALLVGGLGVAHAISAWLETRTQTIAILKTLGAGRWVVFQAYMAQATLFALIGILAGLALGAALPFAVASPLGERLGVAVRATIYPWPLALAALFGALTAALFTLWPLARAAAIAPATLFRDLVAPGAARPSRRAALGVAALAAALAGLLVATASDRLLAGGFVAGAAVAVLIFHLAAALMAALARRAPRLPRPAWRLAVANLHRPGSATPSAVLSLGLGITVLTAVLLVEASLRTEIEQTLPAAAPTFYFIDVQPSQREAFRALVAGWPGVSDYKEVPMLRGRITRLKGVPVEKIAAPPEFEWVLQGDRGLTWAVEPPPGTRIVAGAWWKADSSEPLLVSFDAEIAVGLGLGLGDSVTVNVLGRELTAEIANLREVDWGRLGINFVMIFSPKALQSAPQMALATIHVPPGGEDALERAVSERFANISAIRVKEALETMGRILAGVGQAIRAVAGVTLAAGLLVLAGVAAALRRRRVYDAVVLKVLGATRADLLKALLAEHLLLGLATAAVAAPLGAAAAYAVLRFAMEQPFRPSLMPMLLTVLLSLCIATIFGVAGSLRAVSAKAAPYLRNP